MKIYNITFYDFIFIEYWKYINFYSFIYCYCCYFYKITAFFILLIKLLDLVALFYHRRWCNLCRYGVHLSMPAALLQHFPQRWQICYRYHDWYKRWDKTEFIPAWFISAKVMGNMVNLIADTYSPSLLQRCSFW